MLSKIAKTRALKYLFATLTVTILSFLIISAGITQALPYGSGDYGECKYGQNCPASTSTGGSGGGSTTTSTPTATDDGKILLNNFNEYFTGSGKQLELKKDQVVYFDININGKTESHYLTMVTVGTDYVEFTFDGSTTLLKLTVGSRSQYDVTNDNKNDIEITLNSLTDDLANMTFKQVGTTTPTNTKTPEAGTTESDEKPGFNWTLPVFGLMFLAGLIWLIILFLNKRKHSTF